METSALAAVHDPLPAPRPRAGRAAWIAAFTRIFAETRALWVLIGAYALAAFATAWWFGVSLTFSVAGYFDIVVRIVGVVAPLAILVVFLRIGLKERSSHPTRRMIEELRVILRPERTAHALTLLVAVGVLQSFYAFFKPLIPRFVPFSWDTLFAAADRLLFFGHEPWQVLWPIFGNGPAIFVLNFFYNFWFFWMILVWVLVAFSTRHHDEGLRYFLAVAITWIVGGTLLAIVFSSAGPCYYGDLGLKPDPFAGLIAHLDAINTYIPVFARETQALLWDGQMHPGPDKIAGISAMPSMHCATALLRTRIAFTFNRRLGWISAVITTLIVIGSICLAWHYAVDSLAGLAVGYGAWLIAGRFIKPPQPLRAAA